MKYVLRGEEHVATQCKKIHLSYQQIFCEIMKLFKSVATLSRTTNGACEQNYELINRKCLKAVKEASVTTHEQSRVVMDQADSDQRWIKSARITKYSEIQRELARREVAAGVRGGWGCQLHQGADQPGGRGGQHGSRCSGAGPPSPHPAQADQAGPRPLRRDQQELKTQRVQIN